jgi:signal transduction histidine kinase
MEEVGESLAAVDTAAFRPDVRPQATSTRGATAAPDLPQPLTSSEIQSLYARAHQATMAEQRQALASDLHDSVMQTLFSLHLAAQVARDRYEREPAQACAALDMVLRLAADARREMRTLLFELRENALASDGLAPALQHYADLVGHQSDLQVTLQLHLDRLPPLPYQELLYRLAREGLTNVIKHAQARHAWVILSRETTGIRLRVEDDGVGFAEAEPECASCGIRLLREKLHKRGGTLRLGNRAEGGAYLEITLPLPEEGG